MQGKQPYSLVNALQDAVWLVKDDIRLLIKPTILILILEALQMVARILVASLFDYVNLHDRSMLAFTLIGIISFDAIMLAVDIAVVHTIIKDIGYRMWKSLTMKVVRHVGSLDDDFFTSVKVSKITERVGKVDKLVDLVEQACFSVTTNVLQAVISLIVLWQYVPWAIPITIMSFGLFFRFNDFTVKRQSPARLKRKKVQEDSVTETIMRIINSHRTLVENDALERTYQSLDSGFDTVERVGLIELSYVLKGSGIMRDITLFLGRRLVLVIAVLMAVTGHLNIANLVLVFTLTETMFIGTWGIARFLHTFVYESASITKLAEIMRLKPQIVDPDRPNQLTTGALAVSFEGVDFSYRKYELVNDEAEISGIPPEALALRQHLRLQATNTQSPNGNTDRHLHNINLCINAGEMVALVGASGAGKSTLASLVMRTWVPDTGTVCLNGIDIRQLSARQINASMARVPQGTGIDIYNDTLKHNITLGDPAYEGLEGDLLVVQALQAAALWETVAKWEENIYASIGERGRTLSGGQIQRVAIARAFLRNPGLIILDEATSALDTETEREIQASLDSLLQGRTAIVIAHRLSTIEHADKIVVMEAGKIIEYGTKQELLELNGAFRRMYQLQHFGV
jgi:ABC-type multidrug transport system fused ATPase/permease subunit